MIHNTDHDSKNDHSKLAGGSRLNVYVPELQRVGQVVGFLTRHRGFEIASTALVAPMSKDFVAGIGRYAVDHGLPLIDFVKVSATTTCCTAPIAVGVCPQGFVR